MTTVSEGLVNLSMAIRFEDLPSDVIREAGRRVPDAFGCIIAGSTGDTSQQVSKGMLGLTAAQESSILGTRDLTSCAKATLINCTCFGSLTTWMVIPGHIRAMRAPIFHPSWR